MSESDIYRQDGSVPLDDIVSQEKLNEFLYAYEDGFGTIHLAPPVRAQHKSGSESLQRVFAIRPEEREQLRNIL